MLYLGTSGYSYKDWQGTYYPNDLKKGGELIYYSQEFNFLELNYTFYRIPTATNLANMEKKVPDDFQFAVKLHQSFTHDREYEPHFREALQGFQSKLIALLAQFPYSFKNTPENQDYLIRLRDHFIGYNVVYEFRHDSWANLESLEFIKKENLNIAAVDEPVLKGLLPPMVLNTGTIGYVRFHGRNSSKWWQGEAAHERYTYEYSPKELAEWLPRLEFLNKSFKKTYVAFNNHYNAGAVRSARMLRELLENDRLLVK
jgi:uncharacterized protein YecE (DUF72 family)